MRTGHVQQSRPQWYDRTPIGRTNSATNAATAPHAETVRWTRTIPTAKKYQLQTATVLVRRESAAAPASYMTAAVRLFPNGAANVIINEVLIVGNAVNDGDNQTLGGAIALLAGDVLEGITQDSSTGGTALYRTSQTGLEYDA
jgi:hypothetical protein